MFPGIFRPVLIRAEPASLKEMRRLKNRIIPEIEFPPPGLLP